MSEPVVHTQPTQESTAEPKEEQLPQTYDEKLAADFYKDHSSENSLMIQIILAAAGTGVSYGVEVQNAYKLLKGPIDPKKLLIDPAYKKQVERYLQLVRRHEGKQLEQNGKSKYKIEVARTTQALEHVRRTHSTLQSEKATLLQVKNGYLDHAKVIYGFDDNQINQIKARVWKQIQENPTLSMQEAIYKESARAILKKTQAEGRQETGAFVGKKEFEDRVNRKLKEKETAYLSATEKWGNNEKTRTEKIIHSGISDITSKLEVPSPHVEPLPRPVSVPTPPSIPSVPIPQTKLLFPGFETAFRNTVAVQSLRAGLAFSLKALRSFSRPAAKFVLSFARNALPFMFKTASTLALSAAGAVASFGVTLAAQLGLEFAKKIPVIGKPIAATEDAVFGVAKGVLMIVGAVVLGTLLPLFFVLFSDSTNNSYSSVTIQNAESVALAPNETLTWQRFAEKYLEREVEILTTNWTQFEKGFLDSSEKQLSQR